MAQTVSPGVKPIKLPGPEHPITVEHNTHRVVLRLAGRSIADTRAAPAVNRPPRLTPEVHMAQADSASVQCSGIELLQAYSAQDE